MREDLEVALEKVDPEKLREKPSVDTLGSGGHFTDHMFRMTWSSQGGWHDAKICPYQNLSLDPAALIFHHGQAIFENLKARRGNGNQLYLFRPADSLERLNSSAVKMCMPRLPVEKVLKALKALVYLEKAWVADVADASLSIRSTMIAVDPSLGMCPSKTYCFFIILSSVAPASSKECKPAKIYVSDDYSRSLTAGPCQGKTSDNYGASLSMSQRARAEGYSQVLWLDTSEHRFVEQLDTANIFFKIDGQLVTPFLDGSIIEGLTRNCVITLAESWGFDVVERKIAINEVLDANKNGSLEEVFFTGADAGISPLGELYYQGENHVVNSGVTGELSARLVLELQAIQNGRQNDPYKWVVRVA